MIIINLKDENEAKVMLEMLNIALKSTGDGAADAYLYFKKAIIIAIEQSKIPIAEETKSEIKVD